MLTIRARNSRQAAAQIRRSTARFAVDFSPAESRAIVSMERPVVLDTGHVLSVRAYQ